MTTETFSEVGNPRPWIRKDPGATLDYSFDWTDWLDAGEAIATYAVTVDGVTLDSQSRDGAVVTGWVSGGTAGPGVVASITCEITTDALPSRTDQRTIYLKIRER